MELTGHVVMFPLVLGTLGVLFILMDVSQSWGRSMILSATVSSLVLIAVSALAA